MRRAAAAAALPLLAAGTTPAVRLYDSYNQGLNVLVTKGTSKGGTIRYIGTFDEVAECQAKCLAEAERCWSFVHFKAADTPSNASTLDGSYRIAVKADGRELHSDDEGDKLVSTRYQSHDDYAAFTLESGGGGAYRVKVVADGLHVHADDEATHEVETKYQDDDGYSRFLFEAAGGGGYRIRTQASGRYWSVNDKGDKLVKTVASASQATEFVLSPYGAGSTPGQCYSVVSPGWNPSYDPSAVSGAVEWPCRGDDDCSLNGKCSGGACSCRPAWKGARCETLATLPAVRGAGYRGVDAGHNTSSWGGAVLKGPNGDYHMWAAEMTEHCGIGAWVQNSRIIHATSPTIDGAYTRREVTWGVFAHEPEVVPGPDGEFVMYFTSNPRPDGGGKGWCDCCRAGHGPCDGSTGPGDCPGNSPGEGASYMSWTKDPNGGWSTPKQIFKGYTGGDTNFANVILPNGSFVGMWRRWGGGNGGSRQFLTTGADWKDPSTYVQHETELFPDLGAAGTEDQFVYQDADGYFHAYFHHMYGSGTRSQWWLDATGGHAFSRDGWAWTYTGVAWGDATGRYNTPEGQGATINFTDGTAVRFTRVERPHLAFDTNQLRGDPRALITSAQYGMGTDPGSGSQNDDACYTLIQPVRS